MIGVREKMCVFVAYRILKVWSRRVWDVDVSIVYYPEVLLEAQHRQSVRLITILVSISRG